MWIFSFHLPCSSLQVLEGHNEVTPKPSLFQAGQSQFSQLFLPAALIHSPSSIKDLHDRWFLQCGEGQEASNAPMLPEMCDNCYTNLNFSAFAVICYVGDTTSNRTPWEVFKTLLQDLLYYFQLLIVGFFQQKVCNQFIEFILRVSSGMMTSFCPSCCYH